jgi:hypothetical protein
LIPVNTENVGSEVSKNPSAKTEKKFKATEHGALKEGLCSIAELTKEEEEEFKIELFKQPIIELDEEEVDDDDFLEKCEIDA